MALARHHNRIYYHYVKEHPTKRQGLVNAPETDSGLSPPCLCRAAAHQYHHYIKKNSIVELVGFEPTTPCLQSRCSSQLSYSPL
jgi:hypothetical protein